MKLYHYSADQYNTLLTKRKAGNASAEEIAKAEKEARRILMPGASYVDHISFFFEPIPAEILGKLYGKNHPVWVDGRELYEYEVDPLKLPERVLYEVVESAREVEELDRFSKEHNWVEDDPALLKKWFTHILAQKVKWGEYGNDKSKLLLQIKKHQGRLASDFLSAVQREDFKNNFTKYAASVPHLMLYPPTGEVQYDTMSLVVIGKKGSKFLKRFDD